jgi:alkanesulfonate monooxygenase SsuD/methylene tetrahydromethanopterin reductase-like flavin-dependent oxidoreductase (luciferase family)
MNLLDHLTKGRVLFGIGSGWRGTEPDALGVDPEYHGSGRAAEDTLAVMQRLWAFKNGDPEYQFEVGTNRGRIKRRVTPGPYSPRHPTMIRIATREASLLRAARNGWPVFLGAFGTDVHAVSRTYRTALADANLPQSVVDECLRWCTKDWLSVVVAPTDKEAHEWEREARAEQMDIRLKFIARHGKMDGPVIKPKPGQTVAEAYASGGDMIETIAGSPDTIAAKVQEVMDQGINHLLLRFVGEWPGKTRHICEASARLFAQEVMPRFKDRQPSLNLRSLELNVSS